jgi:uncharacterized membrane protein YfcA
LDPGSLPTLHDAPALLALVLLGAVASAINAVAGGGSLLTFPGLVGMGIPALNANATSSLALWPGSLASAAGYWKLLRKMQGPTLALLPATVLGSAAGAWLLVSTPEEAFKFVVPALVLGATLLLALQPRIKSWITKRERRLPLAAGYALQFAVSVYGGYFGAGMGILMLAVFGLVVEGTIHELNGMKTCLGLIINLLASALFVVQGLVRLWPALSLMAGAITGGYFAAVLAQRAPAEAVRKSVVALGLAMTAWFTWRLVAA